MDQQHSEQADHELEQLLIRFRDEITQEKNPRIEEYILQVSEEERESALIEFIKLELSYCNTNQATLLESDYEKRFPEYSHCLQHALFELEDQTDEETDNFQNEDSTSDLPPREDPAIGANHPEGEAKELGDFVLLQVLGRGGMGIVYKAHQKSLNRTIALKLIRTGELADEKDVERFKVEAQSAAILHHPSIVSIFETGEVKNRHYISMAYIEGQSLSDRIKESPLEAKEAASLAMSITEAIQYAHQCGVIHRDLKPANVLLDLAQKPHLTDFGLAKKIGSDSSLTASGAILGTPSYMPPEQAKGSMDEVNESADIYSLGAIIYAMLCGRPPFQAENSFITLSQVITQEPVAPHQLNSSIPVDLETICLKCLEKDPARRYLSAGELAADLKRFLAGELILARPISRPARLWRWCKRKPLIASLSTAFILSLILGLSFSLYFWGLSNERAERAEEGTRIALRTLESVINTVQEKLRNIPKARDIRKELLKNSMADLEKLSGDVRSQPRVDLNTANVLVDLGELFEEVGDDAGTNSMAAARINYEKAVEIFSQLENENKKNLSNEIFLRDHARALEQLGNYYIDIVQVSLAEPLLSKAITIRKVVADKNPDDLMKQGDLVWAIVNLGDYYTAMRQFTKALEYYEQAEVIAEKVKDQSPEEDELIRMYSAVQQVLGDTYHDMGKNDKAIEYFNKDVEIMESILKRHPDNLITKYDLSFCYERLGNHWLQVKDPVRAEEMYLKMYEYTRQALEGDPDNLIWMDGLVVCYEKLMKAYSMQKKTVEYQEALHEAQVLRTKLREAR